MKEYKVTKEQFNNLWPKVMTGIGNDIVNELVKTCPVNTGFLKNSIRYEVKNDKEVHIMMADYWMYIEFGTPAHIIKAKNVNALHWKSGTKDVFATVVHHPGTDPNPFIRVMINTKLKKIVYNNIVRQLENVSNSS